MPLAPKYDPVRTAHELREQMASAKRRTGLLLGAGSSIGAGLPGLDDLTSRAAESLTEADRADYQRVLNKLGQAANIETVLDRLRLIRELIPASSPETFDSISGKRAKELDIAICRAIYERVREIPQPDKMAAHESLASWIRHVRRDEPLELFTTNYDLLLEHALESAAVSYFDGFVGAVSPFFVPECVEADGSRQTEHDYPPRSWTRVWKLHGSVGWQMRKDQATGAPSVVRVSQQELEPGAELVVYPSRDKLAESRRLPFATYFERMRKFLTSGESMLLVVGYSFRDEDINAILEQALRSNARLTINTFVYGGMGNELISLAKTYRNLSAYGPESATVGGTQAGWIDPPPKRAGEERPFWDESSKRFTLGDFREFGRFLDLFGGPQGPGPAHLQPAGVPQETQPAGQA